MPPGVLRGNLYLAYVHSQMNPQTWTKVGANRTATQDFWIVDPLKPPKCPPCVSRDNLFGVYPFPYEFAHVRQIWCQSAQPFSSFSRICAKVSSAFRRCTRWLAQKHAKNQNLYIENYNSGPNMQTPTSLTFFIAIFVGFSGALAEELMIFCRHVRTELYRLGPFHGKSSQVEKNKLSNSAMKTSIYYFCIAYLICSKFFWEYNKPLLSSGICYAPHVTQLIYDRNSLYFLQS